MTDCENSDTQSVGTPGKGNKAMMWYLVSCLLFIHMDNVGFEIDPARMQGSPRDEVNYLIDLLSQN